MARSTRGPGLGASPGPPGRAEGEAHNLRVAYVLMMPVIAKLERLRKREAKALSRSLLRRVFDGGTGRWALRVLQSRIFFKCELPHSSGAAS